MRPPLFIRKLLKCEIKNLNKYYNEKWEYYKVFTMIKMFKVLRLTKIYQLKKNVILN